jgi:hypothetical protein
MQLQAERFRASLGGGWLLGTHSVADSVEWWLDEHSALLRNRQSLRRPLEALAGYDPPDRDATVVTDLGLETHLLEQRYRGDERARAFFRREPLRDFDVTDDQLAAVRQLASALVADGVRVVVLDVPVTQDYVDLHPAGAADYARYQAAVDAVVAETGAELLRPGLWPAELFSDPLHPNGLGVERLSEALDRYLAAGPG